MAMTKKEYDALENGTIVQWNYTEPGKGFSIFAAKQNEKNILIVGETMSNAFNIGERLGVYEDCLIRWGEDGFHVAPPEVQEMFKVMW